MMGGNYVVDFAMLSGVSLCCLERQDDIFVVVIIQEDFKCIIPTKDLET